MTDYLKYLPFLLFEDICKNSVKVFSVIPNTANCATNGIDSKLKNPGKPLYPIVLSCLDPWPGPTFSSAKLTNGSPESKTTSWPASLSTNFHNNPSKIETKANWDKASPSKINSKAVN